MGIALLVLMVVGLALVTAYEMAVFSTRPEHMRNASRDGDRRGTIVMVFLRGPTRIISSLQIAATFLSLGLGVFLQSQYSVPVTGWLVRLGVSEESAGGASSWVIVGLSTLVVLVLTNLVPKRVAYAYADPLALLWAEHAYRWLRLTSALTSGLSLISDGLLRLFRVRLPKAPPVAERDIQELLRQGHLVGTIDPHEMDVIRKTFALSDRKVAEFMTPRRDIEAVFLNSGDGAVREAMRRSERSQLVVGETDLDNYVGLIRAREVLAHPDRPIRELIRPVVAVPPGASALDLLGLFKSESVRAAVVVGDHGRVLGLATFNDLISILVGEAKAIA